MATGKKKAQKSYSTDIFGFFDKALAGDFRYIDRMTDQEVKDISAYVLLFWVQGAKNDREIRMIMTDLYLNDKIFTLSKNPRLLLKLFVAANCDIGNTNFSFVKPRSKENSKSIEAIARYYQCSPREARDYARILTPEDIQSIMEEMEGLL